MVVAEIDCPHHILREDFLSDPSSPAASASDYEKYALLAQPFYSPHHLLPLKAFPVVQSWIFLCTVLIFRYKNLFCSFSCVISSDDIHEENI